MDKLTLTIKEFEKYVNLTFSSIIDDQSDYIIFKGIAQVLYGLLLKFGLTEYNLEFIIYQIRSQQTLKFPTYSIHHSEIEKIDFKTFGK